MDAMADPAIYRQKTTSDGIKRIVTDDDPFASASVTRLPDDPQWAPTGWKVFDNVEKLKYALNLIEAGAGKYLGWYDTRILCLPMSWVDSLAAVTLADIRAVHGERAFASVGDILSAFCWKAVAAAFPYSHQTISMLQVINCRGRIPLPTPYWGNAANYAMTPPSGPTTYARVACTPLSEVAYMIRESLKAATEKSTLLDTLAWRLRALKKRELAVPLVDGRQRICGVSNVRKISEAPEFSKVLRPGSTNSGKAIHSFDAELVEKTNVLNSFGISATLDGSGFRIQSTARHEIWDALKKYLQQLRCCTTSHPR
jgi:hypothetical protein